MTVAASGAGASCLAVQQQQDGSLALVLTAIPTSRNLSLRLTETQAGYDNSPLPTDFNLTYEGVSDSTGPGLGTISLLDKRTITPARGDTNPQTWPALFNPADRAPYVIDLKTFLGEGSTSEALDTLVGVSVDAVAAALGVMIDDGDRRPMVDRTNKRLAIWLKVDPAFQGPAYFTSIVNARIILTFVTSGSPVATYRRSGFLQIKQVI